MVAGKMAGPRTLDARFFGWVETAYVRGAQVRFFDGQGEAKGVVRRVIVDPKSGRDVPARGCGDRPAGGEGESGDVRSGCGSAAWREVLQPGVR